MSLTEIQPGRRLGSLRYALLKDRRAAIAEAGPMLSLTVAQGAAMLLSFLFYILAARVLAPQGFGVVRYTITLSEVAFGALQVLATCLVRELGSARGDVKRTSEVLGTCLVSAVALWLAACAGCIACYLAGLTGSADLVGLLVVFSGLTAFTLYWSIGRGLGEVRRMALTYIGGSAVQLLAFIALVVAYTPTPRVALIVFGASSFVPIVICEATRPVIRREPLHISRSQLHHVWIMGRFLFAAQLCYMLWNASDQAWVDNHFGAAQVGFYGAASNLSRVFLVLQIGVATILLPRVAELREKSNDASARRLVIASTSAVVTLATGLFVVVFLSRETLLEALYGHVYTAAQAALLALAAAMLIYTAFATVTTAAVGWGRPGVYLVGMGCSAATQLALFEFADLSDSASVAWAHAASIGVGLAVVCLQLARRPLRGGPPEVRLVEARTPGSRGRRSRVGDDSGQGQNAVRATGSQEARS